MVITVSEVYEFWSMRDAVVEVGGGGDHWGDRFGTGRGLRVARDSNRLLERAGRLRRRTLG